MSLAPPIYDITAVTLRYDGKDLRDSHGTITHIRDTENRGAFVVTGTQGGTPGLSKVDPDSIVSQIDIECLQNSVTHTILNYYVKNFSNNPKATIGDCFKEFYFSNNKDVVTSEFAVVQPPENIAYNGQMGMVSYSILIFNPIEKLAGT